MGFEPARGQMPGGHLPAEPKARPCGFAERIRGIPASPPLTVAPFYRTALLVAPQKAAQALHLRAPRFAHVLKYASQIFPANLGRLDGFLLSTMGDLIRLWGVFHSPGGCGGFEPARSFDSYGSAISIGSLVLCGRSVGSGVERVRQKTFTRADAGELDFAKNSPS